ncbi:MAG: hypothetical protein HY556_12275 [Euryarchaeota archaeon]|nr:hypothetical protein [Euryarchaeota archaeon]
MPGKSTKPADPWLIPPGKATAGSLRQDILHRYGDLSGLAKAFYEKCWEQPIGSEKEEVLNALVVLAIECAIADPPRFLRLHEVLVPGPTGNFAAGSQVVESLLRGDIDSTFRKIHAEIEAMPDAEPTKLFRYVSLLAFMTEFRVRPLLAGIACCLDLLVETKKNGSLAFKGPAAHETIYWNRFFKPNKEFYGPQVIEVPMVKTFRDAMRDLKEALEAATQSQVLDPTRLNSLGSFRESFLNDPTPPMQRRPTQGYRLGLGELRNKTLHGDFSMRTNGSLAFGLALFYDDFKNGRKTHNVQTIQLAACRPNWERLDSLICLTQAWEVALRNLSLWLSMWGHQPLPY